jgi:hypothetical protein
MWAQGDDLSVVTDNDETGFRVVEYGKSRKVVLPDSLKREIENIKLRELRHVRVNTYRKIVAALARAVRKPRRRGRMSAAARRKLSRLLKQRWAQGKMKPRAKKT